MKASPHEIVVAHYRTYVDPNTGKVRVKDHALFAGIPIIVFGVGLWRDVQLSKPASAALLTVSGLMSAFLFGAMLQVSARAMEWADAEPPKGPETSSHAVFLREIAANAAYAALVSIATTGLFILATVTTGTLLTVSSAAGLALDAHLVLVLLMVMNRVYALTVNRLTRARTGTNVTSMERRREAR